MSIDFSSASLLYSNLGGLGPDESAPPVIRYVNVGTVYSPQTGPFNIDLQLSNHSAYASFNTSRNNLVNGKFAQVTVACNTAVRLRVTVLLSCTQGGSCTSCRDPSLSSSARTQCFAAGCDCYGTTVYNEVSCSGAVEEEAKASYGCANMGQVVVLPSSSMVTMSLYDFVSGTSGEHVEQVTFPEFEYYKTPLRASSGNDVTSTVYFNPNTNTFTSTEAGAPSDPADPQSLTDEQARRGVQLFFRPQHGYIGRRTQ